MIGMAAAIFLLSGCAKLELSYVIEEDGTVEASYLLAVEEQLEMRADMKHLMDAASQQAEISGFSISVYDEDGYFGFQADKTINVTDLRQADSDMLGFPTLPSIITDYSWHYEPSVFRDVYQIRMDVDLRNLVDETAVNQLPSDLKTSAREAIENSEATIHITLPGKPTRTNADQTKPVNGKNAVRYSWTLHPGEYETLTIDAALEKSSTKNQFIWGVGAVIGLLIFLICFYFIWKVKTKKFKKK